MPERGRVRFALVTNQAVISDGLFHMLSAGWNIMQVPELPAVVEVNLAAQLVGMPAQSVVLGEIRDPEGQVLAGTSTLVLSNGTRAGGPAELTNLLLRFVFEAQLSGEYRAVLTGDDVEEHDVDFHVMIQTT